tara:strand:- start:824 stop:1354 length:531 start_codon:yes stop_codon:yes gene_type:complete
MHRVILFRGGMCGDLILSMLDKSYVKSVYPLKQKDDRWVMKKFYNFSMQQKDNYFRNTQGYTLSHDTDYCKTIEDNVIQLYCSDVEMLETFSRRFWSKNPEHSVKHVVDDLNSDYNNRIKDYKHDIELWQDFHVFKKRFDIKNVFKKHFVDDVRKHFEIEDLKWANTVHEHWLSTE